MFRTIILSGRRQPYCFHNTYMEHKGSQCLIWIPGKKGNSQAVEDYKLTDETYLTSCPPVRKRTDFASMRSNLLHNVWLD